VFEWLGLARSLAIYWRPGRQPGLRRLYRPLVRPGDVVFDIGAHVGDRTRAFASLGAHVVALEPQPLMARWLGWLCRGDDRITLRTEAAGATQGHAELAISRRTPTVSTLARDWRSRVVESNAGFRTVDWDRFVRVPVNTLDHLIARYGVPSFCKIDVEGHEAEVLLGLSRPLPALSLEFVAGELQLALDCVVRLGTLAAYEFNVVEGEQREFRFAHWQDPAAIEDWLRRGADGISSGDLYARQPVAPPPAKQAQRS
jgi:FkbM family methyltransferase